MTGKILHKLGISVILLLILGSTANIGIQAKGAGIISIYNAPPSFVTVKILDSGERIQVIVEVSDMNGWEDIFRVYVNTTDSRGNLVESALYSQYPGNSSTHRIDLFSESAGNSFIPGESEVTRFPYTQPGGGGWGRDWFNATYQRMTFVFKPFSSYRIHVEAFDRKMEKCEYNGPFSSKYEEPPIISDPTVPLGISLVIASGAGAALYVKRRQSNKMARLVEERMRG